MLPHYVGKYEPKQYNIDFEPAREILRKEDYKMVVKIRSERIHYTMMDCKTYTKNENIPENKEIFIYSFKHVKTDKVDNYVFIGSESDVLFENNKLFNFWYNKFKIKEIESRDFKLTEWLFMTLVKRNNVFKIQGISM